MLSNKEIEKIEEKYLSKFYHFLKFTEDEMLKGFETKEIIKDDWFEKYKTGISDFAVWAERIVYSLFNGKWIGQPNSSPVGSDLFFEVDDAYIHIDLKTVKASLTWKTNIGDYLNDIFVGNNQNSYNGKLDVNWVEKTYYNANLPYFYTLPDESSKVCLTYFVTILYDEDTLNILNINILNMPNGKLFDVYGKDVLKAGKVQTALTTEERKLFSQTVRYKWSKNIDFKLLDNKKRIKVVYFNEDMHTEYKRKLTLIKELYNDQNN